MLESGFKPRNSFLHGSCAFVWGLSNIQENLLAEISRKKSRDEYTNNKEKWLEMVLKYTKN